MTAQGYRPNQMYVIETPSGRKLSPPEGRCWSTLESEFLKLKAAGRICFGKDGNTQPNIIRYLSEVEGFVPWTWWPHDEAGHTDEAKKEIQSLFGTQTAFDTTKPTRLIQRILQIATDKDSLILDSFAGSGTTGHAVLKQNAEDGGHRRFILVEIDENIARNVTAERVRRVCTGYTRGALTPTLPPGEREKGRVPGLGGGFRFCRLSAAPLFTADGQIRPDVSFAQLAEFVWFAETGRGRPHPGPLPEGEGEKLSPLLGVHEGRAIYLLYNGILKDRSAEGGNVLTGPVLDGLPPFAGPKVIYAAASRLGTRAAREGITFKQTPYALEV